MRTIPLDKKNCVKKSFCLIQERPDLHEILVEDFVNVTQAMTAHSDQIDRETSTDMHIAYMQDLLFGKDCDINCDVDEKELQQTIDLIPNLKSGAMDWKEWPLGNFPSKRV